MDILEIMSYSTPIYGCHLFYNGFMFPPSQYSSPEVSGFYFFLELSQLHHGSIKSDAGHKTHTEEGDVEDRSRVASSMFTTWVTAAGSRLG